MPVTKLPVTKLRNCFLSTRLLPLNLEGRGRKGEEGRGGGEGEVEEPRGKRGRRVGTLPNQHGSSRTMNGNHWQKVGWRNVGKGREVLLHQVTERMYN